MARPQDRGLPSSDAGRRTPMAVLLAALGLLLLAWGLLWLPRVADALRDRRLLPIIAKARQLGLAAERYRAQHGTYPKGTDGYERLTDAKGVCVLQSLQTALRDTGFRATLTAAGEVFGPEMIQAAANMAGKAGIRVPMVGGRTLHQAEGVERTLLVVGCAGDEAIAITPGPGVRVTPGLAPSAAARPKWLHVVDGTP